MLSTLYRITVVFNTDTLQGQKISKLCGSFEFLCLPLSFFFVQMHTVNPCVNPEGTVSAILSPLSSSKETHRFPSAVKSAEMLVVACHSY